MAKRDELREQMEQGLSALNDALEGGHSEQLARYLEVMGRFHHYSFGNLMLIDVRYICLRIDKEANVHEFFYRSKRLTPRIWGGSPRSGETSQLPEWAAT